MTKKNLFILLFAICSGSQAQVYMAREADISFFSPSTIENIEAHNGACKPVISTATGEMIFKVPVTSFKFSSALMQEHFNENYMESDKFPFALFAGKLNEKIDYAQNGCYKVTATGTLTMHGVTKNITAEGTLTVNGTELTISSVFNVHLADYDIKVPSLYVDMISENVEVRVH